MNKKYLFGAPILLLVSLILIFGLSRISNHPKDETVKELTEPPTPEPITYRYGIPVDSFNIEESVVKRDQNLSGILLERGMSYATIDELAKKSKPIFDVRRIKAGKNCVFFWTHDSLPDLKYLVYEKNLEEFIIYDFGDSINVSTGKKDISLETRFVSGVIESSAWNAMVNLGVSTRLSIELEDIYAWTIDFFTIQKGDKFRIVYTVRMLEGEAIGIDKVLACSFVHGNQNNYAFGFTQNRVFTYFDETGHSLRRAFLKAPLKSYHITSKFSKRRYHPILRIYRPHSGVDYGAPAGTAIFAIGDGKVVKKGRDKAAGNYLRIKHNSVYQSGYNHMSSFGKGIKLGSYVKQGQIIGRVGSTGYATGPHLDFRMYKNGTAVDPLKIKSPPVEPVVDSLRTAFESLASDYIRQLDNLK